MKPLEIVWTGAVGKRAARVIRFKDRLQVEYAIKGDPGFWSVDLAASASDAAAIMGSKGGSAKVAKGFSSMDPKRRSEIAKDAAAKRWNARKLDATISGQFTKDQLEYMEKTGISPDRFSSLAAKGKAWLKARGIE